MRTEGHMKLPSNVTSHEWETVRRQVLAAAEVCAICGRALQPTAPPRSRWSSSVDHRLPRAALRHLGPAEQRRLILTPSNLQAVHYKCNSGKRDRPQMQVFPRPQSQRW
jgi:5-methylcytosine-specific restriction endonuclease McrA